MELNEKIQALRTCAIRRLQQANALADFADEIERICLQGDSDKHLKAVVRVRTDYVNTCISYRFKTLDDDQRAIFTSLSKLE